MRMIGLIGGLSWESTVCYYQLLNRMARAQLGGLHSAPILLYSFEFSEIAALQEADDWQALDRRMEQAARSLNNAGAELLAIATNTMHRSADHVVAATGLELVHITDCTSQAILGKGHRRPLLLATRFTMEQDFYTGRMRGLGLDPQIPP
ncbi:MAG: amino acid racemase, partial [Pseudomonadota bacterium]